MTSNDRLGRGGHATLTNNEQCIANKPDFRSLRTSGPYTLNDINHRRLHTKLSLNFNEKNIKSQYYYYLV